MITILMSTRNRAAQLRQVLERYCALAAGEPWKAVIVDNASGDQTAAVVGEFSARLPITYLREERVGKTVALNSGLAAVEGDLVVLTDDDILAPSDWLTGYRVAAAGHPECSVFAGPAVPVWPRAPEGCLTYSQDIAGAAFSASDPRLRTGPLERFAAVMGGNFAVRSSVFAAFHFDPEIGPRGAAYAMGSETEFLERLVNAGHRIWWERDIVVQHVIRPEQMRRAWVLRRGIRLGRGYFRRSVYARGEPRYLFGVPRYTIRALAREVCRAAGAFLAGSPERRFEALWKLCCCWGELVEGRALRAAAGRREGPR